MRFNRHEYMKIFPARLILVFVCEIRGWLCCFTHSRLSDMKMLQPCHKALQELPWWELSDGKSQ